MTEADIANLRRVIEHQSKMESLWSDPFERKATIQEHLLRAALRHLHAIVEKDNNAAFMAHRIYWDLENDI